MYRILALLMVFALLLPATLAFLHSTQNHDHIDRCEMAADTHMHEKKLDCDFDDIVLQKLGVYAFAKAELIKAPSYPKATFVYTSLHRSEIALTDSSRGPPLS